MKEESMELVPAAPAGELAVNGMLADFEADAGQGFENVTAKDMAIPFITVLQSNSPQVQEGDGKYIDGARPGMLYNTVTGEVYDGRKDGITVIPCFFQKLVVEWRPRDSGGGIAGRHAVGSDEAQPVGTNEKGKPVSAAGNTLEDTAYHFVLIVKADGNVSWGVLALKSTQLKHSKKWLTVMNGIRIDVGGRKVQPPMFAFTYKITTVLEENAQGKWYGLHIEPAGMVQDANQYAAAKAFALQVKGGKAKMSENEDGSAAPASDDVPF